MFNYVRLEDNINRATISITTCVDILQRIRIGGGTRTYDRELFTSNDRFEIQNYLRNLLGVPEV